VCFAACSPKSGPVEIAEDPDQPPGPMELALARQHHENGRPDLALAILAGESGEGIAREWLADHVWHVPSLVLDHPGSEIRHLALHDGSLWVGLAIPPFETVVRWNLESLEIDAVLLPSRDALRAIVFSPGASHAVVARGDVTLLVNSRTLKPIADLGKPPENVTPESVIAFRPDALLVAHPDVDGWHIRDTATGGVLRSVGLEELPSAPVRAAHLDKDRLRLLAADGTCIDVPIAPTDPLKVTPFEEEEIAILHAHIVADGESALVALDLGPHTPPAVVEFGFSGGQSGEAFDLDAWAIRQPLGPLPCLANGLFRHLDPPPVAMQDGGVRFHGGVVAPVVTGSETVAYAADDASSLMAVAEVSGRVTLHRVVAIPENPDSAVLEALAGYRWDRESAGFSPLDAEERHARLETGGFRRATHDGLLPLWHRLADAVPAGAADLVTLPDLSLTPSPVDHAPARALASALLEGAPAVIRAILESTPPPPTLHRLATARAQYLDGDVVSAFHPYHDGFPDLAAARLREDWHGWERPDFQPAVAMLEAEYRRIIDTLTIDPDADESARRETIARLTAPSALATLGRARYATACLDAAMVLADFPDETEAVFTLAVIARHHGAPAVPCLRAEALALTTLESYREAHRRWIELITEHPVEEHLPADYSEAAYTAFENDDTRQALEILIAGMARFEGDAGFAIRAGWIALLAGHPEHGGAFLLRGREAGFPEEQAEQATAMLATAAVLVYDSAAAVAYFQELLAMDPAWGDPEKIESLPWPDHLLSALRQLAW